LTHLRIWTFQNIGIRRRAKPKSVTMLIAKTLELALMLLESEHFRIR
jgi:hypothetical protein